MSRSESYSRYSSGHYHHHSMHSRSTNSSSKKASHHSAHKNVPGLEASSGNPSYLSSGKLIDSNLFCKIAKLKHTPHFLNSKRETVVFGKETVETIDFGNKKVNVILNGTVVKGMIITGGSVSAIAAKIHGAISVGGRFCMKYTVCFSDVTARSIDMYRSSIHGAAYARKSFSASKCERIGSVNADRSIKLNRCAHVESVQTRGSVSINKSLILGDVYGAAILIFEKAVVKGARKIGISQESSLSNQSNAMKHIDPIVDKEQIDNAFTSATTENDSESEETLLFPTASESTPNDSSLEKTPGDVDQSEETQLETPIEAGISNDSTGEKISEKSEPDPEETQSDDLNMNYNRSGNQTRQSDRPGTPDQSANSELQKSDSRFSLPLRGGSINRMLFLSNPGSQKLSLNESIGRIALFNSKNYKTFFSSLSFIRAEENTGWSKLPARLLKQLSKMKEEVLILKKEMLITLFVRSIRTVRI